MENQTLLNLTHTLVNITDLNNTNSGIVDDYNNYEDGGGAYSYETYEYYADFYVKKYEYIGKWEITIRGYVTFFIALATILSNIVLVSVLVFRSSRTFTTIVLTSLAITDSIICLTRLPEAVYFNMAGNYKNLYITYPWCIATHVLYVIYQVFRMMSNWLTALLGVQRLVAIALPFKHGKLFNSRASCVEIAVIVGVSVMLNLYEALGIYISELPIYKTWYYNETLPSSCTRDFSQWSASAFGDPTKSNTLFFIFSGLLYRVLPVLILIFTTVMLVYFLYKRQKMRALNTQRKKQIQRMTILIFLILVVFLIAETQDGIAHFIYAAELSQDKKRQNLSKEDDIMWDTISSMLSLISYACNVWIFFLMSQQFRSALLDIFKSGFRRVHFYFHLGEIEEESVSNTPTTNLRIKNENSTFV
ncbi:D(2) dopamine receptor A-like [Crassostrea angulata]|uniref:D(2) dopamine receptor A-like n=1 Tax=Magallana angulata TaxID=2784310 RepID=UPI0022B0BE35|nr:D(2) dopamine receptor A-like [Crassostrea angulata]